MRVALPTIASVKPYLPNVRLICAEPYFWYVKRRTRGMMTPFAYRELHDLALDLPDLPFVEVGAGAGASSIALARAFKYSGKRAPIISIEKCAGSSRAGYGGFDDNLRILNRNLSRFGVLDRVRLFALKFRERNADELFSLIGNSRIAGFMHDADGRLDRDFAVLWRRVVPGGLIVVDDYEMPDLEALSPMTAPLTRKQLMIKRGLDLLIDAGMFVPERYHGHTVFGRKPNGIAAPQGIFSNLKQVIETAKQEVSDRIRDSGST